jgi:hypothetical protein
LNRSLRASSVSRFFARVSLWITHVEEGKISTRLGHREDAKPLGRLPAAA